MADAGAIWFHALSGIGNNISDSMQQYHKEQEQQRAMDAFFQMGSQMQLPDPNDPQKTVPLINKQFAEAYQHMKATGEAKSAGRMEALMRLIQYSDSAPLKAAKLQQEQAQAKLYQRAVEQPIGKLGSGETVINTPHGASIQGVGRGAATMITEAGRAARFQATQALRARKDLLGQFATQFGQEYGLTSPEDLLNDNLIAGNTDPKDKNKFVPLKQGDVGGTHIRIGADGPVLPKDAFIKGRRLAAEYQKLGQMGYGGLTGGQQTDPVKVNTPDEARKLPPGTIYVTPNGDQYQVPSQ